MGAPDLIPFMMVTVGIGEILAVSVLGNFLPVAREHCKGLIFKKILARRAFRYRTENKCPMPGFFVFNSVKI